MNDLKERLKKALKEEFGIETEEDFKKAMKEFEPVDLGIFTQSAKKEGEKSA